MKRTTLLPWLLSSTLFIFSFSPALAAPLADGSTAFDLNVAPGSIIQFEHLTIEEGLSRPTDLALSPSGRVVYVVDAARCRIQAFDREGKLLQTFGSRGDGPTDFVRPFGIAVDADANVYVSDEPGHKIVKFDAGGRPVAAFGREGLGRVEFFKPKGLAFDARGRLVVVDWGNHRGQVLTVAGEFVRSFGARLFIQPTLK